MRNLDAMIEHHQRPYEIGDEVVACAHPNSVGIIASAQRTYTIDVQWPELDYPVCMHLDEICSRRLWEQYHGPVKQCNGGSDQTPLPHSRGKTMTWQEAIIVAEVSGGWCHVTNQEYIPGGGRYPRSGLIAFNTRTQRYMVQSLYTAIIREPLSESEVSQALIDLDIADSLWK